MYHIKDDKRAIQSSEFIYDALAILIQEKDYSKITITELVEKSQVGRTTFYRNFDTIDDVLQMKCDEKFSEFGEFLLEYNKSHRFDEDKKKAPFLKPFLLFWYNNSSIIEILIKCEKTSIIKESFFRMCNSISTYLPDNKEFMLQSNNYFLELRSAVMISILTEWIRNGKNMSPDDLLALLVIQTNELINLDFNI